MKLVSGKYRYIFCLFPEWIGQLKQHIEEQDWDAAASVQKKITVFRDHYRHLGGFSVLTPCMNLLGYEGNFAPDYCLHNSQSRTEAKQLLVEYSLL